MDARDFSDVATGYDLHVEKLTIGERAITIAGVAIAAALRKLSEASWKPFLRPPTRRLIRLSRLERKPLAKRRALSVGLSSDSLARHSASPPDAPVETPSGPPYR